MSTEAMKNFLEEQGYSLVKELPEKGWAGICRMAYTVGLFFGLDISGYYGRYCYPTWEDAAQAIKQWDGSGYPPGNWIKYKGRGGEYSNPKTTKNKVF